MNWLLSKEFSSWLFSFLPFPLYWWLLIDPPLYVIRSLFIPFFLSYYLSVNFPGLLFGIKAVFNSFLKISTYKSIVFLIISGCCVRAFVVLFDVIFEPILWVIIFWWQGLIEIFPLLFKQIPVFKILGMITLFFKLKLFDMVVLIVFTNKFLGLFLAIFFLISHYFWPFSQMANTYGCDANRP